MTTPTDPIPEFKLGADRYARREPVVRGDSERPGLDPETQEVVEAFEALYAELSSSASDAATAPEAPAGHDDDLQIDLPEFESAAPAPDAAGARAFRPERQLVQSTSAPNHTQSAAGEVDTDLDIDDAFAVLRAAESKGRANAARDAGGAESAARALPSMQRSTRELDSEFPYHRAAPADWTSRARALWPRVAGAAVIALIVGTGVGYMMGRMPASVSLDARIPMTPQGGAKLQFDYELGQK